MSETTVYRIDGVGDFATLELARIWVFNNGMVSTTYEVVPITKITK